jgi:hypothetical protein
MKSFIRRLARRRYALYGMALQGVIAGLFGLYLRSQGVHEMQDNPLMTPATLIVLGVTSIVLGLAALVSTYLVDPVLEGVIVELQQPQLPDAHVRTHRAPELPKAA